MRDDLTLVIWASSPPFVEKGAFTYLEDHWPGGVVYAVLGELRSERAAMGWGDEVGRGRAALRARGPSSVEQFCNEMLREYPDALHLVGGLSSVTGRALSYIVRSTPPERVAVFSERPGAYGPLIKRLSARLVVPIKYSWLVRRHRRHVGLLLPLGEAGVEAFTRYGWPSRRLAPFMYCPPMHGKAPIPLRHDRASVRLLYVGRLSRFTKGTDVLLKAAERLRGRWSLTLVGSHGDLVETVRAWATTKDNVEVVGALTPAQVNEAMANHDICIVPSRFDGWNVVVNEALYAGRGVIVTDEAVSHELIRASRAGTVVKARSARRLATAMQSVIDDPSLARLWSGRALDYVPLIAPATVGQYLSEQLRALVTRSPTSDQGAPWLRDHGLDELRGRS